MVTPLNMTGSYTVTTLWLVITTFMSAAASDGTTAGGHCPQKGTLCCCVRQELTSFNSSMCSLNTTKLDLSENNLTVLQANIFTGLLHLIEIDFDFNPIVFIDKHAFSGLLDLRELRLTNTNLSYLHPDMILGNPSLRELHLKKNPIEIPEYGPLLKSESLLVLGLQWCAIDSLVGADAFRLLSKLGTLNLSGNSLNKVNVTPFQPLIKLKTEIIHESGICSDALRETILQLNDGIQFKGNCNVTTTTTTEISLPSIQPNETREFLHSPFDINFIIASTMMVTCVLVIILVVYVCFVQCTIHCRSSRQEAAIEKRPRIPLEHSPFRDQERYRYNDGYLRPLTTPRTEQDVIRALPTAIPPYLEVLSDEVPKQSDEKANLDVFPFKTRLAREDSTGSTKPLLSPGSDNSGTSPPDGYMKMDAAFNYPGPTPSSMVVIDGTKESKELKNRAASFRSLVWVDNETAKSLHPPPEYTVPDCRGSKQDLGIAVRPLPPVPPRLQPIEAIYQPGITTTAPLPLPTRNAVARQHPLTVLGGKLCFN